MNTWTHMCCDFGGHYFGRPLSLKDVFTSVDPNVFTLEKLRQWALATYWEGKCLQFHSEVSGGVAGESVSAPCALWQGLKAPNITHCANAPIRWQVMVMRLYAHTKVWWCRKPLKPRSSNLLKHQLPSRELKTNNYPLSKYHEPNWATLGFTMAEGNVIL